MNIVLSVRNAVAAAVMLITAGAACAQQKEISIGLSSASFAVAGPRIAQQMGMFGKYGVEAKFIILDGSTAALAGLIAGSLDIIEVSTPDFIATHARNDSVVAIDSVYSGFGTSMVISKALADKIGVSPTAPLNERMKALAGQRIATVSAASSGTVPYRAALQAVGVNQPMVYMGQPAMQAALETGAIDGYTSSAPFWAFPVATGKAVLWVNGPKGELPPEIAPLVTGIMVTTTNFAAANPETIKKLRLILTDLAKAVQDRPNDVKAVVGQLYPSLDATSLDVLFATESRGWNTTRLTPQILAKEISFVKSAGIPVPDIDKLDAARMIVP